MVDYTLVLALWTIGLAVAVVNVGWHYWQWRHLRAFTWWCRYGVPPMGQLNPMAESWLREAVYHLGLRVLLVLLALERLTLQLSILPEARGDFGDSPLQIGLAVTYLAMVLWVGLWSWRRQVDAHRAGLAGL